MKSIEYVAERGLVEREEKEKILMKNSLDQKNDKTGTNNVSFSNKRGEN